MKTINILEEIDFKRLQKMKKIWVIKIYPSRIKIKRLSNLQDNISKITSKL